MTISNDDPRPPYLQVAAQLRAAILAGTYAEGDRLPSQAQIAETFGVARMTAQQALRILREQGLISSRTGSGNFVRARSTRPAGLRPHIEEAFRQEDMSLDFYGYTAETLAGALSEPLDRVRSGEFPIQRISLRLLVLDTDHELVLPGKAGAVRGDEPRLRARMGDTTDNAIRALNKAIEELVDLGLLEAANVEVRRQPIPPMQKLYVINRQRVFWGYYPVKERDITVGKQKVHALDPVGKDMVLFEKGATPNVQDDGSAFVDATLDWYDTVWDLLGTPYG